MAPPAGYVTAAVPGVPLASASADLLYTGKGALIWLPDLTGWARDVARLLRPSGTCGRVGALLAEALQETGGALSDSERAWADEALSVTQRGGRSTA